MSLTEAFPSSPQSSCRGEEGKHGGSASGLLQLHAEGEGMQRTHSSPLNTIMSSTEVTELLTMNHSVPSYATKLEVSVPLLNFENMPTNRAKAMPVRGLRATIK
jgi:hypothetical protein